MNNLPKVSLVIPFYNQGEVVERVINAVLALNYPTDRLEVIAVDDGSTDNTRDILARIAGGNLVLLFHESNRGRAHARNTGINKATGDLVGFLDGDMVVDSSWLLEIVGVLRKASVVACMGESLPQDGQVSSALEKYFYSHWRGARKHGANRPIPFKRFLFNNTVVKREALEKTGLFDETYLGYGGEDTDLAIRFWKLFPEGLRFCPEARVFHHHRRTVQDFCRDMRFFGEKNLPILIERYPQLKKKLIGSWSTSVVGRIFFNRLFRTMVKNLAKRSNLTVLTRYLVVNSVIEGLRLSKDRR